MGETDSKPEDLTEPLSATRMFLRAFGPGSEESGEPAQFVNPAPPAPSAQTGAGEFTRVFGQNAEHAQADSSQNSSRSPGASSAASTGGDFTQIFVRRPLPVPEDFSVTAAFPTESLAGKGKGYSSRGVSDSASTDGGFRKTGPAASTDAPIAKNLGPMQSDDGSMPPSSSSAPLQQLDLDAAPLLSGGSTGEGGVTELLKAFSRSEHGRSQDEYKQPRPTPVPFEEFSPPQQIENKDTFLPSANGVTALLDRLTHDRAMQEMPVVGAGITRFPVERSGDQKTVNGESGVSTGPGEFTRIIAAMSAPGALSPQPVPNSAPSPSRLPVALPAPPVAVGPAFLIPSAPNGAPPKVDVPLSPSLPVHVSKLQEMLPLLLVANAFLMIVLILVVIFALHAK